MKRSFLDYLSGMADFELRMGEGARVLPRERAFSFPVAGTGDGEAVGAVRFAGVLSFTAHLGALRVLIAEPWLEPAPGGARLTVSRPEEWGAGPARFVLADLQRAEELDEDGWAATRFDAVLAPDGVALFAGVYPPGEPFEPVVLIARPHAVAG